MAKHVPGVGAAYANASNTSTSPGSNAPFSRGALGVLGRVVGLVDIVFKRIDREVVIRGANVGVAQLFTHQPQ